MKTILIGILWAIGIQAFVWPPAYVFQAPTFVYWVIGIEAGMIGSFLWWVMPPLQTNDKM